MIGVGIIFTTNELEDRTRNFKSNAFRFKYNCGKKCAAGQIFYQTKFAEGKTHQTKCTAGQSF